MIKSFVLIVLSILLCPACRPGGVLTTDRILTGGEQLHLYNPLLKNKSVGIVANHTSVIGNVHIVDTLLSIGIEITKIFALEHGFRGNADAGEPLDDQIDPITGLPIISLYGNKHKPVKKDLTDVDIMVFDIQDVGTRFYTYLSSLHYVLEACAENSIPLILLDRPNPNGFYIDGPILDSSYRSFVGMHPIPIVHGMTLGELAGMIIGEKWINNAKNAKLTVIKCLNYTHDSTYRLKINPSPNLQSMKAIYLYPTLGLFEGTIMSVGRGTDFPFVVFGHPDFKGGNIQFTPKAIKGISKNPKYKGIPCNGIRLDDYALGYLIEEPKIHLEWIILAYNKMGQPDDFFNAFFYNLSGTRQLKKQIQAGWDADEIRLSWKDQLSNFMKKRKKYLLYPDFQ